MIGQVEITGANIVTDSDGKMTAMFNIAPEGRYAVRQIEKLLKKVLASGKSVIIKLCEKHNKRTLDQNALLWALLTVYADEMNGGRTGGIQAEDFYYRMLEKYGKATFVLALPEAKEDLERVFREVKRVDTRTAENGAELAMYKCYIGSSHYDTKEMADLIDGVFDELANMNLSQKNYIAVNGYKEEWNNG